MSGLSPPVVQHSNELLALSASSDPKFVGLRQHHLEYRHERWSLAEVAVAHYVGVDVDALCVGSGLYAPGYVVQSSYNGRGELHRGTAELCQ